jgi:hypothetical protein
MRDGPGESRIGFDDFLAVGARHIAIAERRHVLDPFGQSGEAGAIWTPPRSIVAKF